MTDYWSLSDTEAAAALQEFLDERAPALEWFRQLLEADGHDPDVVLDGTVKSLRPVWSWVKSVVTEVDTDGTEPTQGPSWLRHCVGNKPTLSPESVVIVDGLISYVCRVVERGAPHAHWRVGYRPIKSWVWQNHPVLSAGDGGWALGELVQRTAQPIGGWIRSKDDDLALRVEAFIDELNRTGTGIYEDEPLVEVEDALDWLEELEAAGAEAVRQGLNAAADGYIEAPDGSVAVAAAEITAAAQGNPHGDLPEDVATWVTAHGAELTAEDAQLALEAVERVAGEDSELAELWDEADEPEWKESLDNLSERLRTALA